MSVPKPAENTIGDRSKPARSRPNANDRNHPTQSIQPMGRTSPEQWSNFLENRSISRLRATYGAKRREVVPGSEPGGCGLADAEQIGSGGGSRSNRTQGSFASGCPGASTSGGGVVFSGKGDLMACPTGSVSVRVETREAMALSVKRQSVGRPPDASGMTERSEGGPFGIQADQSAAACPCRLPVVVASKRAERATMTGRGQAPPPAPFHPAGVQSLSLSGFSCPVATAVSGQDRNRAEADSAPGAQRRGGTPGQPAGACGRRRPGGRPWPDQSLAAPQCNTGLKFTTRPRFIVRGSFSPYRLERLFS